MGLDMYLYRTAHPDAPRLLDRYNTLCLPAPFEGPLPDEAEQEAQRIWDALNLEEVGYWRKANAIHAWLVNSVQHGVDDQRLAPVTLDHLLVLRNTIATVRVHPKQASALLPTRGGFLFGSTDYDAWYEEDLQRTLDILDPILADPDSPRFTWVYNAWW
ncbi:MAG: hypothetical protein OWV35_04240 [Firmicutes bacterium]|nr:hypothetical protein [Bacillota bacterium]